MLRELEGVVDLLLQEIPVKRFPQSNVMLIQNLFLQAVILQIFVELDVV